MTLKPHRGRCAHCGHDHDTARKMAEYRALAAPKAEGEAKPITSAVLSIPGAVRANLSPKAIDMLQRGADALSQEDRQSRAEKITAIANVPLAAPVAQAAAGRPKFASKDGRLERAIQAAIYALDHAHAHATEPEDRVLYGSAGMLLEMLNAPRPEADADRASGGGV